MDVDRPATTAGELRRRLSEIGNPWTVDPALTDDDPLPERPRGAQAEDDQPPETRMTVLDPAVDLRAVLATAPPANPALRAHWIEAGLLPSEEERS